VRRRDEAGAVTAETAVVLPLLVVLAAGLAWLLTVGVVQVQVIDAARESARALARSDQRDEAIALGRRVAPEGARFGVSASERTVTVSVSADVRGPGGVFARLFPAYTAHASAVAATEPGS